MCQATKDDNASMNRLNYNSKHDDMNESSRLTGSILRDSNFKVLRSSKSCSTTMSDLDDKIKHSASNSIKKISLHQINQENSQFEKDNYLKVYSSSRKHQKKTSESML